MSTISPLTTLEGLVAPLDRANVDTDAIIPKQFLRSIKRTGFGEGLFYEWRFVADASTNKPMRPNADFVLNQPRYKGVSILLTRENFGCGSSREHAVWALRDFGIRCVVGPSFADIFYSNCLNNGLLPIAIKEDLANRWFGMVAEKPGMKLLVDVQAKTVYDADGIGQSFKLDEMFQHRLLEGADQIALTLHHRGEIEAFEQGHRRAQPWLFAGE